jgi:hypothetical protein
MYWRALLLFPALLVDGFITVLGWFIVPILAGAHQYTLRRSRKFDDRYVLSWTPEWAQWWGNEEDGIDGMPLTVTATLRFKNTDWIQRTKGWSQWRRIVLWAAFRNGASNLRFTPWWGLVIDPREVKIEYVRGFNGQSWFVSHGWRSNFFYQGYRWRFWIGWKIKPWDFSPFMRALPDFDPRSKGTGFALQFKRAR